ncbi:DUF4397 domain-containing protein [Halomicrobium salinisoli]|uniref:DUF4397 domain-containing protein n=1 Tax=Halomicrobium salinisoli TaxID=2878391 RepID=UPI001CF034AA|nr:DUF4397 domain-containing protein [Halomicrobium salinisoli]
MTETNITRRRVVQGAGAVGLTSVFGSALVTAQDGGDGQQGSAVRVAHMSPDAPPVDVQIDPVGDGTGVGGGNETDGGLGENDTAGDGTATEGGGGDGGFGIEGVGFREVSNFREVDPGTYRVRILPAQGGILGGLLGDLFGGGGDDRTVLYEDQLEVAADTTYTLTAFGEVTEGPVPADGTADVGGNETDAGLGNETDTGIGDDETDGGLGDNETDAGLGGNETATGADDGAGQSQELVESLAYGEAQTVEVEPGDYMLRISEAGAAGGADGVTADGDGLGTDNETDAGLGDGTDGSGGERQRGFRVAVLETDVSDPGDQAARLQVFHAVPDVGPVSIDAVSAEAAADGGTGAENGTNDTAGNGTDGVVGTDQPGVRTVSVTLEANAAYTGFASGYFDPEEAPEPDEGAAGNESGGVGGNDTVGEGTATPTEGEDVAQTPDDPEFELVVVQDAQGGERSDGGTGGGIL